MGVYYYSFDRNSHQSEILVLNSNLMSQIPFGHQEWVWDIDGNRRDPIKPRVTWPLGREMTEWVYFLLIDRDLKAPTQTHHNLEANMRFACGSQALEKWFLRIFKTKTMETVEHRRSVYTSILIHLDRQEIDGSSPSASLIGYFSLMWWVNDRLYETVVKNGCRCQWSGWWWRYWTDWRIWIV